MEIADAEPVPFPGFDRLVLDRAQLQAVMREHRCACGSAHGLVPRRDEAEATMFGPSAVAA